MVVKRYLLFDGSNYYPAGGMYDYVGDFDTIEEAKDDATANCDWAHIIDRETMKEVAYYWAPHKLDEVQEITKVANPEYVTRLIEENATIRGWH